MARVRHTAAALAVEDIVIPQGADWDLAWAYSEAGAIPPDWPAGWVGRAQVRETYAATTAWATFDSDDPDADGEVILDTATDEDDAEYARVSLVLDGEVSSGMAWGDKTGPFDIELEHVATGRVVRMLEGSATLSAEATTSA